MNHMGVSYPISLKPGKIFPFSWQAYLPKGLLGGLMDDSSKSDMPILEEMSVSEALSQCLGTAREVVERYSHCTICGGRLHFSHITDFAHNTTQEIAKCPECGVRVRRVMHRLQ
jgi:uncharacterized protein with PIN domain